MATTRQGKPSVEERRARGKEARAQVPVSGHAGWVPAADRPDPVGLLEEQNVTREADLVPVRHGRMMVSAFTFYRGAAKIMAADLKDTPTAGLTVQLCGDAHLSNFGFFASPERALVFDLNDFDETLPGPFEYDVKRMAASFTIAARNNAYSAADVRAATRASVRAYREAMAGFAQMRTMDVWYAHLSEDELMTAARGTVAKKDKKQAKALQRAEKGLQKARTRDSLQALSKLGELVDGRYRIVSQPPIVVPARDLAAAGRINTYEVEHLLREQVHTYRATLQPDPGCRQRRHPGYIVPLQGRDQQDPLFLQIKQASASVLEDHLPKSRYAQHGERVVHGQRMMQATSDIYLGWTKGVDVRRHFYWRQLRDMKGSVEVETMAPFALNFYAGVCGWTLARAHARSGDPIAIAAYLGNSDKFDRSITDFCERYADQNEQDYQTFTKAIRDGKLEALEGV